MQRQRELQQRGGALGCGHCTFVGAELLADGGAGLCGRKFGCLTGTGGGVLETLLCGDSSGDGDADMAGWFAIVGDHAGDRAQSTWTEACDARRMTQKQAVVLGGAKLLLWHWSQPGAFLWLLYVFRGEVTALGPTQQSLAAVVATREVLGS